jgi:ribosomal protein S18 acetylase RimI-like enzyme
MVMHDSIQIRGFTPTIQEYTALATVGASMPPQYTLDYEYRDAGDWRGLDAMFAQAGCPLVRYVAEVAGLVVAYAYYFEIAWAAPPGRYWCVIRVLPAYQRHGIGGRLYTRLLGDLAQRGAVAMQLELDDTLAALAPALKRRGFRELLHSWAFALDPRVCDLAAFATAYDRLGGLEITTLAAELARGADWLASLHDLYLSVAGDVPIPIHPHPAPPPEWLARQAIGLPESLPEAFVIVRDDERYVAMSYLHADSDSPGRLLQRITAVHPAYRGRGIALALKRKTIEYGQRHGCHEIRTAVESNNPSMLAINRKLGFAKREGLALLEKTLS